MSEPFEERLRAKVAAEAAKFESAPDLYDLVQARAAVRWRRRRRRLVVWPAVVATALAVAVIAIVLASGGRPQTVRVNTPSSSTRTPASRVVPTRAGEQAQWRADQAAARLEAAHLLRLVALPSGSVPTPNPPAALSQPVNGTLGYGIDDRHSWRVPRPYAATLAWLDARAPKGSRLGAGSTTTKNGVTTLVVGGYTYFGPTDRRWANPELEVGVTAAGPDATAVRIDAAVGVLDPVPLLDKSSGPRVHFTVAEGCPGRFTSSDEVTNPGRDLDATLLPLSTPRAARICQYGTATGNGSIRNLGRLSLQRTLSRARARALATTVADVTLSHPELWNPNMIDPVGCADIATPLLVVAFAYPHGPDVDLRVVPSQCDGSLDNGTINAQSVGTVGSWINRLLGEHLGILNPGRSH